MVRGEEVALARVYDRLAPLAYGLALRITGEPDVAEDVVQDVFLGLWRRAERYDPGRGDARAWLLRVVRSRAVEAARGRRARAGGHGAGTGSEPAIPPAPADVASVAERGRAVRGALEDLPPEQRRAIEVAYLEGLSLDEIAECEQAPVGTVKTRIRNGLIRLREGLAGAPRRA